MKIDQMGGIVFDRVGKWLTYAELTAPNGLESGARE